MSRKPTYSELNEPFTAGHQRKVIQLTCAIAKELGLSEKQFKGIYMVSRIHDIGKIKVPAEMGSGKRRH